jgi:hypothetical protein
LHVPLVQHTMNLVLPLVPNIIDDDSIHSNATYLELHSEGSIHGVEQVVQPDEEPTPNLQQMPKWA